MSFTVPKGWGELKQDGLRKVLELLCIFSDRPDGLLHATMSALLWFCNIEAVRHTPEGWLCREKSTGDVFILADGLLSDMIETLSWMEHPEEMTVRIEDIEGCKAVDIWLRDLPFGKYLQAENYYQAYLQTQDGGNLEKMAYLLYNVPEGKVLKLDGSLLLAVLFWYMAIKKHYSVVFGHFLKPVTDGHDVGTQRSQMELMNAQIRLLTKGDVTKNEAILNVDTWSAMTELDALAHESEEFKRKYGKQNV